MTFNEANVNRDKRGKFDNKVGAPANISLNAGTAPTLAAWRADMERLRPVLEPHVVEIDGQSYLSDSAPEEAARLHARLTQIGYANGFLGAPSDTQLDAADHAARLFDETLPHGGNRYDGLQAIAYGLSPRKAYEPITVAGDPANGERSGFGLAEVTQDNIENPEVPWTLQLDDNGLPSMLSYKGTRLRYNSDEYKAADKAALTEYGLEETEAERNTRHLRDEFDRALRDGIVQEAPSLGFEEDARAVTTTAVIGQSRDGRDITLNFFHMHSDKGDTVLHFTQFDGKTLVGDEERRLLENSGYSDLSDALTATQESGNFQRRATGEEWDEHGQYVAEQKAAGKTPKEFKEWFDEKGVEDGTFNYQPYKADNLARVYEAFHDEKWRKLDQY